MGYKRRESDAKVEYTQEEGDRGRDVNCVYVVCQSSKQRVGPVWGHGERSVKRALAELSGSCSCGARFHNALNMRRDDDDDDDDEDRTRKPKKVVHKPAAKAYNRTPKTDDEDDEDFDDDDVDEDDEDDDEDTAAKNSFTDRETGAVLDLIHAVRAQVDLGHLRKACGDGECVCGRTALRKAFIKVQKAFGVED